MKRETKDDTMSRKAAEFETLLSEIRERFYDMPAPESGSLTWEHVGNAIHVVDDLHAINEFLTK